MMIDCDGGVNVCSCILRELNDSEMKMWYFFSYGKDYVGKQKKKNLGMAGQGGVTCILPAETFYFLFLLPSMWQLNGVQV